MDIKMFQMGFGESILLYEDNSCLLVDCGSESRKREEYFDAVKDELTKYKKRALLITHFHSDHINGIKYMGEKVLSNFERIYLPNIFDLEDKTLELLITEYLLAFLLDRRRKSSPIWESLISIVKVKQPIFLVRKGTQFDEVGHSFRALWPIARDSEINKEWLTIKDSLRYLQLPYEGIEKIALDTKDIILRVISRENDLRLERTDTVKKLLGVFKEFRSLRDNYVISMQGRNVVSIPKDQIWESYREIKNKNETSIVFQTCNGEKQILMTGDITPKILKKIVESDSVTQQRGKKHFDVIKAPHHGTERYYFDFPHYYDFNNLYISNGETTYSEKTRGKISNKYFSNTHTYSIICHNSQWNRCEYICNNKNAASHCVNCKANPL